MKPTHDTADLISEHERLVRVLRSPSHADDLKEAQRQADELREYRQKQRVKQWPIPKPATETPPGLEIGDTVYFHHPQRGPLSAKIIAQGKHGATACCSWGDRHQVRWNQVLGVKERIPQTFRTVDQGEDGMIVADPQGKLRYIETLEPDTNDEKPRLQKALTPAQIKAGNYKKQHLSFQGLRISIENPKDSVRRGTDPNGKDWCITMRHAYGYIRNTCGVDKDHVDCYIGPNPNASHAYVVHQRKAGKWKQYDEDKVMLGFNSAADAKAAYLAQYDDPRFFGTMTAIPMIEFKRKALATRTRPQMIKGLVLFFKARQFKGQPGYALQTHRWHSIAPPR